MKLNFSFFSVLILVFGMCVFAQDVSNETRDADKPDLEEQSVEYLRDTVSVINTLRTNENRISFSSELANLMWLHDEKEARKMFSGVTENFIQLLAEYNAQVEALGGVRDENDLFGGFSLNRDQRRDAIRKIYKARDVRAQVALAIAEHDAQLGYDFVIRTAATVTDEKLAGSFTEQNEALEKQILERMAARNIERSLAFGRRSLKRGVSPELVGLAKKIYDKDPEAAIAFGGELVDKVRSEANTEEESFVNIYSILQVGGSVIENLEGEEKPLFDKETLVSLAELFANNLMRADDLGGYMLEGYIGEIEKYSPSLARRVEAKFANKKDEDKSLMDAVDAAAAAAKDAAGKTGATPPSAEKSAELARDEERDELMKELQEFGKKELSKDQKSEFIAKARRIVGEMNDPTTKIMALASLATQVKQFGDSELALEIMREGNALVKPNPKNFMDYMLVWSLASGYSQVEPDEAFPLLEDAIYRLNDTIGAFVKVAEFIDVQGDFVIDGEVQLGAFGGSMTRSVVGVINGSDNIVKSLAEADFDRTKALAERFEKPEVRILARFLVLRSVLENNETKEMGLIKVLN